MGVLKMVVILVGAILVGFLVAAIALLGEHAFLLWVSIGLLIVYGISVLLASRRSQ